MHVLKQPLQESGKSCPFVQGAPGSTTSCVLFTPSLTPAGFFPLLRTWLSSSVPRLGWWIQERAQLPRIFPVPAAATRPSPAPSSTPTPGSRPTILLAKQNVLGSVFCWPDPGIPVPKTLLLARLLSPKSWSGSFFPWGQTFLWLLVPPASTQRTKHVAPSRRFHSWPSCCLQKPSGPALASGCFLPPQSLVSEKGGPWWRPGKPGSWWGRDPSVALAFLLSGTHTYQSLRWKASMKRIFCSWGCAPCSVTVKVSSDQWHPTHDMLRPHLRAQLTEPSGTLWTPCVTVTTVPVKRWLPNDPLAQKYKVLQRNNCVFPQSTENGPFLPCFA